MLFYEGKIFIDNYILRIEFIGKGNRKNHKQTLFLNIVKRPQTIKSYKGGLGLVLAAPMIFTPIFVFIKWDYQSVNCHLIVIN